MRKTAISIVVLVVGMAGFVRSGEIPTRSKWDEDLLTTELRDVHISAGFLVDGLHEIMVKHLVRANLFLDPTTNFVPPVFVFDREKTTGKELIDSLLVFYSTYTCTQDPETGVIWIHPKRMNYEDILNRKVEIKHTANQVPVYTGVVQPLCNLLFPDVSLYDGAGRRHIGIDWARSPNLGQQEPPSAFSYWVDLNSGVYSARQLLNLCCAASPTKAFVVRSAYARNGSPSSLEMFDAASHDPVSPPRSEAVRFWEIEVGKLSNGPPSLVDLRSALCDSDPKKRWAAGCYWEAAQMNYMALDLIQQSDSSMPVSVLTIDTFCGFEAIPLRRA